MNNTKEILNMGIISTFSRMVFGNAQTAACGSSTNTPAGKQQSVPQQPAAKQSVPPAPLCKTPIAVYDCKGAAIQLSEDNNIASGREGTVYSLPHKDNVLVKLYDKRLLDDQAKYQRNTDRLFAMLKLQRKLDFANCNKSSFAWPVMPVFDKNKKIIGFVMFKCEGVSFRALGSLAGIKRHFPDWTRRELALTALDFVSKLRILQKNGAQVNDFNPSNFLVDRNCNVSFIDCDSFQIAAGNKIHVTNTFMSSHCAPELLKNRNLLNLPRPPHQQEFGAAIIVFNLLMCGLHPFAYYDPSQATACGTPEENLLNGRCPLGVGAGCKFPVGNWYNLWSWTSHNVKGGFIRTFRDGHSNPMVRTSLADWEMYLHEMIVQMTKYAERSDIFPTKPNLKAAGGKRFNPSKHVYNNL